MKQFQVIQNSLGRFTIRFVADCSMDADSEEVIRLCFREVLGDEISVGFENVSEIPRSAGGKYMTALSELAD